MDAVDIFVDNAQIVNNIYVNTVNNGESTDDQPGNGLNDELDAPAMSDATDDDYNQSIDCNHGLLY